MGGLGRHLFCSSSRLYRRTLHQAAYGAQGATLEPPQCGAARARRVVENLFSTASGPVSTVLRSRSGAAFCCWLGPWFHTALLCCNGPCPHEPPRCGLNSSPSHTDAMCNLPQFAKSLGGLARCCLATALAITFYSGKCVPPSFLWSWCHGRVGWDAKIFQFSASSKDAASGSQRRSRCYSGSSSVWCRRPARGGGELVLYRFRPSVDSPS